MRARDRHHALNEAATEIAGACATISAAFVKIGNAIMDAKQDGAFGLVGIAAELDELDEMSLPKLESLGRGLEKELRKEAERLRKESARKPKQRRRTAAARRIAKRDARKATRNANR